MPLVVVISYVKTNLALIFDAQVRFSLVFAFENGKKRWIVGDNSTFGWVESSPQLKMQEGGSSNLRQQFNLMEGILGRLPKCWGGESVVLV
jgi:hypothetical protein